MKSGNLLIICFVVFAVLFFATGIARSDIITVPKSESNCPKCIDLLHKYFKLNEQLNKVSEQYRIAKLESK